MSHKKKMISEGGHAFHDVGPITLEAFHALWPSIESDMTGMGFKDVKMIGSTGKKTLSGDIDITVSTDLDFDGFVKRVKSTFGHENVHRIGSNIASVRYPTGDGFVQLDIMMGDTSLISWSRRGSSNIRGHADYSPLKGIVRNILINAVATHRSRDIFKDQQSESDRMRLALDSDKGLFRSVQTRRSSRPGAPLTKDWKNVSRELITSKPDEIVEFLFGKGYDASSVKSFEDVVDAIKTSPLTHHFSHELFSAFIDDIERLYQQAPDKFGDDPEGQLRYMRSMMLGSVNENLIRQLVHRMLLGS